MEKMKFMKEKSLGSLKFHLGEYQNNYFEENPWVDDFFKGEDWSQDTNISFKKADLILEKEPSLDLQNAIIIYESLETLTPSQACDERFWAYLTHTVYWDYMKVRWSIQNAGNNKLQFLKNYYFFGESPFVFNGIARLWWPVYCTVDETREDKYELTRYLFTNQILLRELFKRGFTRNAKLLKRILGILIEIGWKPVRDDIFKLCIRLNREAGVIILDALDKEELKDLILSIIDEISDDNETFDLDQVEHED